MMTVKESIMSTIQPTTLDQLEAEGNKENLGRFGGDFEAHKKLQEILGDMVRQTEVMINDAVSKQEAYEADKEAEEWYARSSQSSQVAPTTALAVVSQTKNELIKVVNNNKKEVVVGSTVTMAAVAGVVFAPGYAAKAAVVMAGVAALGVGFYFRNKLFNK
jgi:hypothetical protein